MQVRYPPQLMPVIPMRPQSTSGSAARASLSTSYESRVDVDLGARAGAFGSLTGEYGVDIEHA